MDGQIGGYLIALDGSTKHALDITINRVIRGELDGLSKKFCPTAPELSAAIRDEMAYVKRQIDLETERRMLADNRPVAAPGRTLWQRQDEARQRMAGEARALLHADATHLTFAAKLRECPAGSMFVAILGEIYGPPNSIGTMLAAEKSAGDVPW